MKKGSATVTFVLLLIAVLVSGSLYFLLSGEKVKLALLIATVLLFLVFLGFSLRRLFSPAHKLKRALRKMQPLVSQRAPADLREPYQQIYAWYMKLSEREKQNFYASVTQLREELEENLQREKTVETLLEEAKKGTLLQRKKAFQKLEEEFAQLPIKVQEKYFPSLTQLKEELEKGV